jgi:hypothetical protein
MRKRQTSNGLTANAVAGCYVVILGLTITDNMRQGLRGFAIKRTDQSKDESYWMSGTKVFESLEPHPAARRPILEPQSSIPIVPVVRLQRQARHWLHLRSPPCTASPARLNSALSSMCQSRPNPSKGQNTPCTSTEARRQPRSMPGVFKTGRRAKSDRAAYDWLSRGPVEGIVAFVQRAKGKQFGLRGAFCEFQWPTVLKELAAAKKRGVDVDVVFDDIDNGSGPHRQNEKAITTAKLKSVTPPRTNGKLMHNKFLVLTEKGKPRSPVRLDQPDREWPVRTCQLHARRRERGYRGKISRLLRQAGSRS